MLKLEKRKTSDQVTLRVRDKERFTNRAFWQAFGIACGLHFFGLLLFHVSPFKVDTTSALFAPIEVNLDYSAEEEALAAESESDRLRRRHPAAPRESLPAPGPLATVSPVREFEIVALSLPEENPFAFLEQEFLLDPTPSYAKISDRWEIFVSGELAELTMKELNLPKAGPNRQRARYRVQIEGKSGKIFWVAPLETPANIASHAESLLANLAFEPDPSRFVIGGEIEVVGGL